ncbi:uncharacterized protein LY79DRAFT_118401 [Colletotrichum navitas]|uniref:Uncharacterized protein n=1 Tax=Colletotrichum navitas TaxID=681940 RepID=A0AAD8Q3E5_9PEZI|nr:uncharacterized protein LY79DRAFT_118401 [Colletotrichum navitas]KAK1595073.1 hypothetical protein LY79DRAFT_118401 [Colletotrichum navitas]
MRDPVDLRRTSDTLRQPQSLLPRACLSHDPASPSIKGPLSLSLSLSLCVCLRVCMPLWRRWTLMGQEATSMTQHPRLWPTAPHHRRHLSPRASRSLFLAWEKDGRRAPVGRKKSIHLYVTINVLRAGWVCRSPETEESEYSDTFSREHPYPQVRRIEKRTKKKKKRDAGPLQAHAPSPLGAHVFCPCPSWRLLGLTHTHTRSLSLSLSFLSL